MINSYSLHGFPVGPVFSDIPVKPSEPHKETNISTHNVELPPINTYRETYVDVSDNKVESLLNQQLVLLKLILLCLGALILSNVFKKN